VEFNNDIAMKTILFDDKNDVNDQYNFVVTNYFLNFTMDLFMVVTKLKLKFELQLASFPVNGAFYSICQTTQPRLNIFYSFKGFI